jgi:hypothetical protein
MHKRVLNLEKALGHGVYVPDNTLKWSRKLERRFCVTLREHDWDWHRYKGERYLLGQAHYEKVIYLAGLIPIERMVILWTRHARLRIPEVFVDDEPER